MNDFRIFLQSMSCLLRHSFNRDDAVFAIPAGLVASVAFTQYPDNTVALYVMWKAIQVSCDLLIIIYLISIIVFIFFFFLDILQHGPRTRHTSTHSQFHALCLCILHGSTLPYGHRGGTVAATQLLQILAGHIRREASSDL